MADNDRLSTKKLALLIDADNVRATFLPIIMREASAIGTIAIRRSTAISPVPQCCHGRNYCTTMP